VALVLVIRWRWSRLARWAPVLIACLAAFDMLHFAHGYQPMGPPSKAIPPRTSAVLYLQRHAGDGRVAGIAGSLYNDWTTVYGLRDVRGYDAPEPSVRFEQLWRLLSPQQLGWQPYEINQLSFGGMRLLDILGARYLVAGPGLGPAFGHLASRFRVRPGLMNPYSLLSVAYKGSDATIVDNSGALPRATVARSVRVVNGVVGVLHALVDDSFNPSTQVIVEGNQPGAAQLATSGPVYGSATVVRDDNAQVGLRASLSRSGLVMLDDQMAQGWTVRVDGRPASALTVDGVMRGVDVPAGTHSIVWSYTVPGLGLGVVLSCVGLLGFLASAAILLVVRRRRTM
jgi:hypothetical protein